MSLEEYLVLHVREGVAVPRSSLSAVALGFQLLKIIEAAPTLRLQELGDFLQRQSALRLQKEMAMVSASGLKKHEETAVSLSISRIHILYHFISFYIILSTQ